jgi:hypothetical protein
MIKVLILMYYFFYDNNNIIERKGQIPRTLKVYKKAEYPKGYYNLKNKSNLPDSESKLGTFTLTQSKRDLRKRRIFEKAHWSRCHPQRGSDSFLSKCSTLRE